VLVVDDEADIRELVSGVLEDEGYSVRSAADSSAALDAIEERRPSLVLLDVWLQGSRLDGLQITAPDGGTLKPDNVAQLKQRSVFDVSVAQAGTYRIAVLNNGAFASWKDKATGQAKRARGTAETIGREIPVDAADVVVTQSAGRIETFVTVGKPSQLKPIGQGLELIATGSPTDLVKGEKSTFTLNLDGQPAKDLEVTVTAGNTQYRDKLEELKIKTDSKGQFSVTWPSAGMYWLDVNTKDNKTTVPQAKERRLSYAATLEVMP